MKPAGCIRYTLKNLYFCSENLPSFFLSNHSLCSYFLQRADYEISANTEYVFDLELPKSFKPSNNDGEVDGFEHVPVNELIKLITTPEVSPPAAKIILDFLIRKGYIDFEIGRYSISSNSVKYIHIYLFLISTEPELALLIEMLHAPLHQIYKKGTEDLNV